MVGASNRDRLELAFKLAERHLGVACLLDAEDVDVDKPDEKSVMTYVAQFLNKYPEPGSTPVTVRLYAFYYVLLTHIYKKENKM